MGDAVILNVDDDAGARYIRGRILRAAGYEVRESALGREAIRAIAAEKPDLVLLDVNLPDVSGIEVCRSLRENPATADVPVVHLSASSIEPQHRVRGLESGADAYLAEPIEPEVLLATVRAVLRTRRAERSQRETEQRYRRLFDANIIGTVTGNRSRILDANDAFLRMIHRSRQDLESGGIDWVAITAPEYLWMDERAIEQLAGTGTCTPFEKEFVLEDGTRVPILLGATAIQPEPDLTWLCFVVDLSERKRLEQKLREAQKLESVGVLAGGVAHDFNNLLTGIMGNIGLALESLAPVDTTRGMLEEALRACERAAELTRQLLAYAGKGRFVVRQVEVSQLISEISRLIHASVPKKIKVDLALAPALAPVEADPAQIRQMVMNLVTNAAEAIGDDPGLITISTRLKRVHDRAGRRNDIGDELAPGDYIMIQVRDTGCGMDEQVRPRIFDPFFTTKFVGRGLGLAAVAGIARVQHGGVQVVSEPGTGSTFRVLLPVARPAFGERDAVLVVDDESVVRRVAQTALEQAGYSVVQAEDGPSAIAALRDKADRICLVILDMSMPLMNGEEALRHMRALRPDLPVIVCSGFGKSETLTRFSGQAIEGFLEKPFTPAQLADAVRHVLGQQKRAL